MEIISQLVLSLLNSLKTISPEQLRSWFTKNSYPGIPETYLYIDH